MPAPFWFRPSQVSPGVRVSAQCQRCNHIAGLDLEALAAAGDVPLRETEARLRCQSRGLDGTGPVCGGRAKLSIHVPRIRGQDGMHHDLPVLKPGIDPPG